MSSKFSHRSTRVQRTPTICKSKKKPWPRQVPTCQASQVTLTIDVDDENAGDAKSIHGSYCLTGPPLATTYYHTWDELDGWRYELWVYLNDPISGTRAEYRITLIGINNMNGSTGDLGPAPLAGQWSGIHNEINALSIVVGTANFRSPPNGNP